jgi:hypothetical protein
MFYNSSLFNSDLCLLTTLSRPMGRWRFAYLRMGSLIHAHFVEDLLFGLLQTGSHDGSCEYFGFGAAA